MWKPTVRADHSATVIYDDGNHNIVYTQHIEYTDFPLDEIKLYFASISAKSHRHVVVDR